MAKMNLEDTTYLRVRPVLYCACIRTTISFYRAKFNFEVDPHRKPARNFCSLILNEDLDSKIFFRAVDDASKYGHGAVMISMGTSEMDEYLVYLEIHGTDVIHERKKRGYRIFSVEDADGNRLTFYEIKESAKKTKEQEEKSKEEDGKGKGENQEGRSGDETDGDGKKASRGCKRRYPEYELDTEVRHSPHPDLVNMDPDLPESCQVRYGAPRPKIGD